MVQVGFRRIVWQVLVQREHELDVEQKDMQMMTQVQTRWNSIRRGRLDAFCEVVSCRIALRHHGVMRVSCVWRLSALHAVGVVVGGGVPTRPANGCSAHRHDCVRACLLCSVKARRQSERLARRGPLLHAGERPGALGD